MRDISLHLMDIIQNSITANATKISIEMNADTTKDLLTITIDDNGRGMSEEILSKVTDPFYTSRTTRKVGLGISLFKLSAEISGGNFEIKSILNVGTGIKADFIISSIDRLPIGDIAETMVTVILSNPEIDFELVLKRDDEEFEFSTIDVKERLGDISITQLDVIQWLKEYISESINIIFGGVLDEVTS